MFRSGSRRLWRLARLQVLSSQAIEECGSEPGNLRSVREFSRKKDPASKPKPTTPRQIVLTPSLKRTLQGFVKEDDSEEVGISRNAHKRRTERALELGRFLATLLPGQIKNVIRWAGLDERVYEATLLVQKMELSGLRQGKQMQYRVLKGLLRDAQLDVLEYVIECVRCGETVGVQKVLALAAPEKHKREKEMAQRWFQGLVDNDQAICKEIYSFPLEMFDREELRRLIREFRLKLEQREKGKAEELEMKQRGKVEESEALEKTRRRSLSKSRRMLFRYLEKLARKTSGEKALVVDGGEPQAPQVVLLEHLKEKRAEAMEILKMKQMTRRERRAYRQSKREDAEEEAALAEGEGSDADELSEGADAQGLLTEGSGVDSSDTDLSDEDEETEEEDDIVSGEESREVENDGEAEEEDDIVSSEVENEEEEKSIEVRDKQLKP